MCLDVDVPTFLRVNTQLHLVIQIVINHALSRNDVFSLRFLAEISGHHQSVIPVLSWRHSYAFSDRTTRYFSFAEARFNSHKYNQYY